MTYDEHNDELILSTGKRLDVNRGIVGISPAGSVYEGYDGWICDGDGRDQDWRGTPVMTPAERIEFADHMIERWQTFRHRALGHPTNEGLDTER
jgi:hypothetical protein